MSRPVVVLAAGVKMLMVGPGARANTAVALRLAASERLHVAPWPAQSPSQLLNTEPALAGVAMSWMVDAEKVPVQVGLQLIWDGLEVTVPEPAPCVCTVTSAVPVPLKETGTVPPGVAMIDSEPDRLPTSVGVKAMVSMQLAPPASAVVQPLAMMR